MPTNPKSNTKNESEQMAKIVEAALADAKGLDARRLDVRTLTDVTDFMLIATGTSERHIKTLAERVVEMMSAAGYSKLGMEGEHDRDWVLVDFVDVVVHVMRAQTRERYDLEGLWDESLGEVLRARDVSDG